MIDNPEYKGEWAPRKIPNPNYFEDLNPVKSLIPIGGVGIELWTMTEDILFDNIYVGHSVEDARKLAEETYFVKKKIEDIRAKAEEKEDEAEDEVVDFKAEPVEFIRRKVFKFIELAKIDPILAFKTHPETGAGLTLSVVTLFGMLGVLFGVVGAQQKPITKVCLLSLTCAHAAVADEPVLAVSEVYQEDRRAHGRRQVEDRDGTRRACRWRVEGDAGQEAEVKGTYPFSTLSYCTLHRYHCCLCYWKVWHILIYWASEEWLRGSQCMRVVDGMMAAQVARNTSWRQIQLEDRECSDFIE